MKDIRKSTKVNEQSVVLYRHSHVQLYTLLDNSEDYIMIADAQGFPQVFNSAYAEIMKKVLNLEMKPGIQPHKLLDNPKDVAFWDQVHARALSGEKFRVEYKLEVIKDNIRYFEFSYNPIIREGKVNGFVEIARDITDRMHAEEALESLNEQLEIRIEKRTAKLAKANAQLKREIERRKQIESGIRESEKRYRLLIETMTDSLGIIDENGMIRYVNDKALQMIGYTREELIGRSPLQLLDDANQATFKENQKKIGKEERSSYEIAWTRKNGQKVHTILSPRDIYNENGDYKGTFAVITDISERIQMENTLRCEKELSESLINSSLDGILAYDLNCCYTIWNPSMERMTGVSKERVLGKFISEVFPFLKKIGEDRYHFDSLEGKHSISRDRHYFIPETGKKGFFEAYYSPLRNESNVVIGGLGVVRDISDRKSIETALKERTKELETKTQNLEEVNTALKVLLKKREKDKRKIEERVAANIRELIVPYMQIIENSSFSKSHKEILAIIKANIEELTKSFSLELSSRYFGLTSTEIQVANLIKQGFKTKEIASILRSSYKTIESHRESIRKKLSIAHQNINLRSFLLSMN